MRVATVDGLVTLFYDGSKPLWNRELSSEWWHAHQHMNEDDWESWNLSVECREYIRERLSWQQIIVVEGVTEIPNLTFMKCWNIKRVIMADTVVRIKGSAFYGCRSLFFCKLSINLEYIGRGVFYGCNLYSVFIPPTCREICVRAFDSNEKLSILNVPQHVELGRSIIPHTALAKSSPFQLKGNGWYDDEINDNMNTWIKNMNRDEKFTLHRACASFQPLKQILYNIIEEKGLKAFRETNSAGITPSQYLNENPYTTLTEKEIINDYLMRLMGEVE
ncbi:hypothetical protein CTEN210_18402 [Chaetoceros tenuissimus]|uniref:Leucine-rich repeat domain-containing protein n=1 Tax=Chaetoceros tenuissimus TaxID=426638 RepID=A0AAD3DEP2_9STRA|nr:hypothetical protein CTEN210_18402 [Chaetoceros tenuissimus]